MAGRARLAAAAALIWTASAMGSIAHYLPDRARLQFAGSQGFLSAGAGYGFLKERIDEDFMYGYLPAKIGGISVHTLSAKTTIAPLQLKLARGTYLYPVMAGVSAIVALGDDYFLVLPSRYQDYYWPSALHLWYFAGMRFRKNFTSGAPAGKAMGFIAELGAIDTYWRADHRNQDLNLPQILSMSLSAQFFY